METDIVFAYGKTAHAAWAASRAGFGELGAPTNWRTFDLVKLFTRVLYN